ncbi:MAG TPA: class I SAM-dependent methyltransferase [Solirubrobacteraceae bacterium]|nr:class I SAM-dependent methyltransferase [Solirubrobacteraceae bacterium]
MAYFERLWSELPDTPPERFQARRDFLIASLHPGSRVLDVGCGAGWFCEALEAGGFEAVGVDVAGEAIRRARERCPSVEFALVAEHELPYADGSFDAAWLGETLEHVQDGIALLEEIHRVIKPGGRLIVTTPDHGRLLRLRLGLSTRAFEEHFEPRSDHVRFFTQRTLRTLLETCGYGELDIHARRGCLFLTTAAR